MLVNEKNGHFGKYGGKFVPEAAVNSLNEIAAAYEKYKNDSVFVEDYNYLLKEFNGRPTPLYFAKKFSEELKGAKIYFKREDLSYGGSHSFNNAAGHILLAKKMAKKKVITVTGNGNNGLAAAIIAARVGIELQIVIGEKDLNLLFGKTDAVKLLGAEISVVPGNYTSAWNQAMVLWLNKTDENYFLPSSAIGPYPFPEITRDFQSIIGAETYRQIYEKEGVQPAQMIASAQGGSGALGLFYPFLKFKNIEFRAVGHNAIFPPLKGKPGIYQGAYSHILQDEAGLIIQPETTVLGLNLPACGPELSNLIDQGRIKPAAVSTEEIKKAFRLLADTEGITCALESAPALAEAIKQAGEVEKNKIIVVLISGRSSNYDYALLQNKLKKEN